MNFLSSQKAPPKPEPIPQVLTPRARLRMQVLHHFLYHMVPVHVLDALNDIVDHLRGDVQLQILRQLP